MKTQKKKKYIRTLNNFLLFFHVAKKECQKQIL